MNIEQAQIKEVQKPGEQYRIIVLNCPAIAGSAAPGQFVHMLLPGLKDITLRRPFSIFKAEDGNIAILYKIVGRGTSALSMLAAGDEVDLMGPLGKGFPCDIAGEIPVLVAGGYGVAPLAFLAKRLKTQGVIFIGGASAADILCVKEFEKLNWEIRIATEDGSMGDKGLVTEVLKAWLDKNPERRPVLYACGPDGMLKAVSGLAVDRDLKAWLSLDKHMGCGVGACLACVQKLKFPDGHTGWGRVCKDGPVFEAREIVWN